MAPQILYPLAALSLIMCFAPSAHAAGDPGEYEELIDCIASEYVGASIP